MNGYRIKEHNNKWQFILYPSNNCYHNQQLIGQSKYYTSLNECQRALQEFRTFVSGHVLNSFTEGKMKLSEKPANHYAVQYIINDEVVFETRPYGSKQNRDTGIKSIYRFINEYTTNNLDNNFERII